MSEPQTFPADGPPYAYDVPLFDLDAPGTGPTPEQKFVPITGGKDAQATARKLNHLIAGFNPATGKRLHRDAPDPLDRKAPGPRCGTCANRVLKTHYGKGWWKCSLALTYESGYGYKGTDLRAWWPACILYEPEVEE